MNGGRLHRSVRLLRLGVARGGIELRHMLTYWPDLVQSFFFSGIQILVLFLMRGNHVPGTTFSLGSLTLPSVIGMGFAFGGMLGVTGLLTVDREDGTLLRAKATPGGMSAYVLGKITTTSATTLTGTVLTLILGLIAFPGVHLAAAGLGTLVWVALLGLLATIPIGTPPGLASVEIDGSWRLPLVFLVLSLWALLGLTAAPVVLRRMARHESGSRVAERRERAMVRAR